MTEANDAVAAYLEGPLRRYGLPAARRVGFSIEGETVPDAGPLEDTVGHVVAVGIGLDAG